MTTSTWLNLLNEWRQDETPPLQVGRLLRFLQMDLPEHKLSDFVLDVTFLNHAPQIETFLQHTAKSHDWDMRRTSKIVLERWHHRLTEAWVDHHRSIGDTPPEYRVDWWHALLKHARATHGDLLPPYLQEQCAQHAWCWDLALWDAVLFERLQLTSHLLKMNHQPGLQMVMHALDALADDRYNRNNSWYLVQHAFPEWVQQVNAAAHAYDLLRGPKNPEEDIYKYENQRWLAIAQAVTPHADVTLPTNFNHDTL